MFSPKFRDLHHIMYERYQLISRSVLTLVFIVVPLVLFVGGIYTASGYEFSDNVRATAGYSAGFLAVVLMVWRYLLKSRLKKDLWKGFAEALGTSFDSAPRQVSAGPVVRKYAKYASSPWAVRGAVNKLPFVLSPVNVYYERKSRLVTEDKRAIYSFKYLVLTVDINVNLPHIFIDGLSQNSTKFRNTNMWSLSRRVSKQDKIIDLEGDFYKFFDIYVAGINQKEVAALSIVTPDVMLALRDKGYNFDYEIHDGKLYVISEDTLETVEQVEAYLRAAEAVMEQLIPQLQAQLHGDASNWLRIDKSRLAWEALVHNMFIKVRYAAAYFVYMAVLTLLVTGLPSVTGLPPAPTVLGCILLTFLIIFVYKLVRIYGDFYAHTSA